MMGSDSPTRINADQLRAVCVVALIGACVIGCGSSPPATKPTPEAQVPAVHAPIVDDLGPNASTPGDESPTEDPGPPPPASAASIEAPPGMVVVSACAWTERFMGASGSSTRSFEVPELVVDVLEVRVEEYAACVAAGACAVPRASDHHCNWPRRRKREGHPINCVTQEQARAYCAFAGKQLPTDHQWRALALCANTDQYPWGGVEPLERRSTIDTATRHPDDRLCWDGGREDMLGDWEDWHPPRRFTGGTCVVGSFPSGANSFGVLDLAGNVWEWSESMNANNPRFALLCGGGWRTLYHTDDGLLPHYRVNDCPSIPPDVVSSDIGIRCVKVLEPTSPESN